MPGHVLKFWAKFVLPFQFCLNAKQAELAAWPLATRQWICQPNQVVKALRRCLKMSKPLCFPHWFCAFMVDRGRVMELVFCLCRCGSLPPFPWDVLIWGSETMGDEQWKYYRDSLPRGGCLWKMTMWPHILFLYVLEIFWGCVKNRDGIKGLIDYRFYSYSFRQEHGHPIYCLEYAISAEDI